MNLTDTINGYLSTKKSDNREIYSSRIKSFINFLKAEKGVNDKNFIEYLSALKIDIILESLKDYIVKNSIKKESVAYFYITTVKTYFFYLNEIQIENTNLIKLFAYNNSNSFESIVSKFIQNNLNLQKVESKDAVDIDDIKLLILAIDEKISESINNKKILVTLQIKNKPFDDLVHLLCLKLMIFTGVDYAGLRILKNDCFNDFMMKITINSYTLHLPDTLAMQLKNYIIIKKTKKIENDNFFNLSNGKEMQKQTSAINNIIYKIIARQDTTGIRKYVITEMIRKGINQSFIMKLTGIGTTIFEDCQHTVNEERHIETNRYLDSKMRNMEIFDFL